MKNLHYLKKFVVMVLAAMMTLSTFALPTFAAGSPTVSGLEEGVIATPYKIADVNSNGNIVRIDAVDETVIKDLEKPESAEIINLAAKVKAGTSGLTAGTAATPVDGTATFSNLPAGIYLVTFATDKAEGAKTPLYIYNPVIVSVGHDNSVKSLSLDDSTKYTWGDTAQVKKSKVPFDKVVDRDEDKNGDKGTNVDNGKTNNDEKIIANDGNRGDTAGFNDRVYFKINTAVPAYADNYFTKDLTKKDTGAASNPQWQVWDKLSDGLTFQDDVVVIGVKADGTIGELPAADFTVTKNAKNAADEDCSFVVKLSDAALYKNRGADVEIRYSAVVNDNAKTNFEADTNNAGCDYTREPGGTAKPGDERTTYHYTFTINGYLDGNDAESWNNREILKVGVDEESGQVVFEETYDSGVSYKGWTPLEGITFKLYKKSDVNDDGTIKNNATPVRDNVISKADGILDGMDKLDAGEYRLVEDLDQKEFKTGGKYAGKYNAKTAPIDIAIDATLRDDGRLDSYKVSVNGTVVGSYKKDYDNNTYDTNGTIEPDQDGKAYEVGADGKTKLTSHDVVMVDNTDSGYDDFGTAADILNSKVGSLPSTGGMGTVLFTIGGAAIMAIALFLLFGGKKKQHQK
ncbi:MAG: isopeptide-forming domain-containing fimbrial protein [Mogibacterium sp.]|nr:isopeptide-forming domain-containing fimbrial protein [Mogibacterium sp.]